MKIPVLIPNIFNHPFTYETDLNLGIGDYVMVPFGKSSLTGIVWDHFEKQNNKNFLTKKIDDYVVPYSLREPQKQKKQQC